MPDIAALIQTTVSTVAVTVTAATMLTGCINPFDNVLDGTTSDACSEPTITPVDVSDWNMSGDQFVALNAELDINGVFWTGLDDEQRCEVVCAYAGGNLEIHLGVAEYAYYQSFETTRCTLTLIVEADVVTGGSVGCKANIIEQPQCVGGRRPIGWADEPREITSVQAQLDGIATMEQVSITAFEQLVEQLGCWAIDERLIQRCRAAAEDERRHVALLVGLGASLAELSLPAPKPASPRSRLAVALHNATEGCVTETWAALLAHWQSQHAADPAARRAFGEIARDEARHADLAWDLHRALCEGLTPNEQAEVEAARGLALDQLGQTATSQALAIPAQVRATLGLPDPRQARALALEFARGLVAAA